MKKLQKAVCTAPPGSDLYVMMETEFLEKKSVCAFMFLISLGRELEFSLDGKMYFLSCDKAKKYVSLWDKEAEQSFDSIQELVENAMVAGKPFLSVWAEIQIETLF